MPEPHVSDRLAAIGRVITGLYGGAVSYEDTCRLLEEFQNLTQALSDQHQIALAYEAQVEQQAKQIGALRAEQARLRAACLEIADGVEWMTCDGNIVAAHIREAVGRPDSDA